MINDILDYSQISNGKLRLSFQTFSLWQVIKDISKLLKFQAKQKGLEYIMEKDSSRDDYLIYSDQNRIKQVLLNLLGNALKFTRKGRIKIRLSNETASLTAKSDWNTTFLPIYKIQVQDTGLGIKKEDQSKLFRLFGKLESEESNEINPGGVGLGLAISQSLVKVLNDHRDSAEITIDSQWGKGSTFHFLLYSYPLEADTFGLELKDKIMTTEKKKFMVGRLDHSTCSISDLSLENHSPTKRLHLLIVDDDQINILVITSFLKGLSFITFQIANNGQEAYSKFMESTESQKFDIILMDCNMPGMDGFEATKLINNFARAKFLKEPWIIACTANASESDFKLCFDSGMKDYLSKPFTKKDLMLKLERFNK
jgi:CheY-like chemotaxis protein